MNVILTEPVRRRPGAGFQVISTSIARDVNDDHSDRKRGEALLIFQVAVDGQQNIEVVGGKL